LVAVGKALIDLTRPARRVIATSIYSAAHSDAPRDEAPHRFDHGAAQRYELLHARNTIRENHERLMALLEDEKRKGGLWQSASNQWFDGDEAAWCAYADHVRNRKCLEIGSGPFGEISPCYWMSDRVIIDPLIDEYRSLQIEINGKTFFTDDIETIAAPSEQRVERLVGTVDGVIVCRNALDHCEDPLCVLANIADYAAAGCYLLLWTDIWHLNGADEGHRDITRNPAAMDAMISGFGFAVLRHCKNVRAPGECLEYGVVARKSQVLASTGVGKRVAARHSADQ